MKKIGLFTIITLFLTISVNAQTLPSWTQKTTSWEETHDQIYVYAVGTANYREDMADAEFNSSYDSARAIAIARIKDCLKVEQLIGYQIIDQEYQAPKMYVLIVVPKALNKAIASAPPPPPPQPAPVAQDENAALEGAISESESEILPVTVMPTDWWNLYKEGTKTFRFGSYLYAIGWSKPNPEFKSNPAQSKESAKRGAVTDAQRNLLTAVKPVIIKLRGNGDWTAKIKGVVRGAVIADVPNNPHILENGEAYVLMAIPLNDLKNIR